MKSKMNIFDEIENIPLDLRPGEPLHNRNYLLDGKLQEWSGKIHEALSPILVSNSGFIAPPLLGSYPLLDSDIAIRAIDSAHKAFENGAGLWPSMNWQQRARVIKKFIGSMDSVKDEVIRLLMWETGKSIKESRNEVVRTIDYLYQTVDEYEAIMSGAQQIVESEVFSGKLERGPWGVVLCMGPSNYPVYETYSLLIPALLCGNTCVLKFPRLGVLLHTPFLEFMAASFPPGVLNVIYGRPEEVMGPIMKTGKVDILSMMGNSQGANELLLQHPQPYRLKTLLGLEAKNPAVVMPHADMDTTAREVLLGALAFNGQRCAALKIIFVHESIAEKFNRKILDVFNSLKIGMPWHDDVRITPISDPLRINYLLELLNDAISKGAKLLNKQGGYVEHSFFYPALLSAVSTDMRIYNEEQFGPIVPIVTYKDIEEVQSYIINSEYGQQISAFGTDSQEINEFYHKVRYQSARININCKCQRGPERFPFSGRKRSGTGLFSIRDTLLEFSVEYVNAAKTNELNCGLLDMLME